jgi:hypothetical protein
MTMRVAVALIKHGWVIAAEFDHTRPRGRAAESTCGASAVPTLAMVFQGLLVRCALAA